MKKRFLSALCLLCLLAGLVVLPPAASAAGGELEVGYGKRDITPRASVPLAGYGNTFTRLSKADASGVTERMDDNGDGVVDDNDGMKVTCIAFRDEAGQTMLWFAHDMTSANGSLVVKLQRRIEKKWGIPAACILVNASHSHSGVDLGKYFNYVTVSAAADPEREGYDADKKKDAYYNLTDERRTACDNTCQYVYEVLLPGFMGAAEDALADLAPAEMYTGSIHAPGLNFIRHYYDTDSGDDPAHVFGDNTSGYSDFKRAYRDANDVIYLLEFDREGKDPIVAADWRGHAKLNSTATSPFGVAHRAYASGDYVNAFRYTLEQAGYLPVFFQGTSGNVNTFSDIFIKSKPTRYLADEGNPTDKDTVQLYTNATSTKASQIGTLYGQKLASWALQGLAQNMTAAPAGPINVQQKQVFAAYDTHENYKMMGGNGVEGMLNEIVTDAGGVERNAYDYLQTYYAYVTVPTNEKATVSALRSKYGINSVYHLDQIYAKFNRTMAPDGAGGYTPKSGAGLTFRLNAYAIGNSVGLVSAPFETFDYPYTYRNEIFPTTFVLGYSNSSNGYLPTAETFDFAGGRGAYEANNTSLEPGTMEMVAETHRQMLQALDRSALPEVCPHCDTAVIWQQLENTYELPGGHYYLGEDFEGDLTQMNIRSGHRVCLHLNGHSMCNTGKTTSRLFCVYQGGELTIMGDGLLQSQGAKITLDPGTGLPASSPYQSSGVIHTNLNSTVNIYGGTIRYLVAEGQWAQYGGVMCVNGVLNMYGGTLTMADPDGLGSPVERGGLVFVRSKGRFNMSGGTLTGGGVAPGGTGADLDGESGGQIFLSGTARIDGGVHLSKGVTMTVADRAAVTEQEGGILMDMAASPIQAQGLADGAELWVTPGAVPQTVAAVAGAAQAGAFHTAAAGRITYADGQVLVAEPLPAGDLTGDGKVNAKDVVLLQRFTAGGYGVTLDAAAADLNGDGKLNAKDVVLLQRFLAGGYGVVLT